MRKFSMKTMKRIGSLALAAAMLTVSLSACGGSGSSSDSGTTAAGNEAGGNAAGDAAGGAADAAGGGTTTTADGRSKVVVGLGGTFESLTPVQNNDNRYGSPVMYTIYEVLAEAVEGGGELEGVLLKEWSTEDYLTWDCVLYDYITDSAGNKITSEDVKYSIDLAVEKAETYTNFVDEVEVVSDTEFNLVLNTDAPGAFEMIASNLYIFSKAAYDASDNGMATAPIGTGPYVCTYYAAGEKVIVEKNENYWQKEDLVHPLYQANVDVIEFQNISEATQMALALENGDIQVGFWVSLNVIDQLEGIDGLTIDPCTHWGSRNFYFDMTDGSMFANNLALRQAVIYAIDGEAAMLAVTKGYGEVSKALGDPSQAGYNTAWEDYGYSYDPDKAAQLFEEAKPQLIADGFDPDNLSMRYLCYNNNEELLAAESIQADLKKLGINVEIVPADGSSYTAAIDAASGEFEIAAGNGNFGAFITTFWSIMFDTTARASGNTRFGLHDEELDRLYKLCTSREGYTQENLDAFNKYITDNALIYQYYKLVAMCVHEDDITIKTDWRNFLRVNCFEYADSYSHVAE